MESKKAEKCILYYDNAAVAVAAGSWPLLAKGGFGLVLSPGH